MNLKNEIETEERNFGATITAVGRRHMEQMTVVRMAIIKQMSHQMDQEAQVKLILQLQMKVFKETQTNEGKMILQVLPSWEEDGNSKAECDNSVEGGG